MFRPINMVQSIMITW